jgi:uncharacterized protein YjbJ (UPF0337 family)
VSNSDQARRQKVSMLVSRDSSQEIPGEPVSHSFGIPKSGESRFLVPLDEFSESFAEFCTTSKMIRRHRMRQSTKDETKGSVHEAKGAVKEKVGQVTNRPHLTEEGQHEKFAGKIQKKLGQIEKVLEK